MKKLVLMLLAIVTCMSCEKSETEKEMIVISNVLDSGRGEEVTEKKSSNADGSINTLLEYSSWIKLQFETKTVEDKEFSVLVAGKFSDIIDTIDVRSLSLFSKHDDVIEYKVIGQRTQDNINIVDSAMIYNVTFSGGVAFRYQLNFEVPIYNDGTTNYPMPYHRVKFVRSNRYTVQEIASQIDGDKTYACKIIKHSIVVSFNGQNYTLSASILCRKLVSKDGTTTIVSSRMIDEGKELMFTDYISYRSWIKLGHLWSDKSRTEKTYEVTVSNYVEFDEGDIADKVILSPDLKFTKPKFVQGIGTGKLDEVIKRQPMKMEYIISCEEFSVSFYIDEETSWYDDDLSYFLMPYFRCQNEDLRLESRVENNGNDLYNGKEATHYCLYLSLFRTIEGKEYKLKEQTITLYKYK